MAVNREKQAFVDAVAIEMMSRVSAASTVQISKGEPEMLAHYARISYAAGHALWEERERLRHIDEEAERERE